MTSFAFRNASEFEPSWRSDANANSSHIPLYVELGTRYGDGLDFVHRTTLVDHGDRGHSAWLLTFHRQQQASTCRPANDGNRWPARSIRGAKAGLSRPGLLEIDITPDERVVTPPLFLGTASVRPNGEI